MDLRALVVGGAIPATLLGLGTVLMKLSIRSGISIPVNLMIVGGGVLAVGAALAPFIGTQRVNIVSASFALSMGVTWAVAIFSITYAMDTLRMPVSIIAPLTNSNAIIAVLAGALILAEWKHLDLQRVLVGTLLIVTGAWFVTGAAHR